MPEFNQRCWSTIKTLICQRAPSRDDPVPNSGWRTALLFVSHKLRTEWRRGEIQKRFFHPGNQLVDSAGPIFDLFAFQKSEGVSLQRPERKRGVGAMTMTRESSSCRRTAPAFLSIGADHVFSNPAMLTVEDQQGRSAAYRGGVGADDGGSTFCCAGPPTLEGQYSHFGELGAFREAVSWAETNEAAMRG